jgi:hypothetical protein
MYYDQNPEVNMHKVWVLPRPTFGFSEVSTKVCDLRHSKLDGMICKLAEEITTNQAILDLSETPIEVFLKPYSSLDPSAIWKYFRGQWLLGRAFLHVCPEESI